MNAPCMNRLIQCSCGSSEEESSGGHGCCAQLLPCCYRSQWQRAATQDIDEQHHTNTNNQMDDKHSTEMPPLPTLGNDIFKGATTTTPGGRRSRGSVGDADRMSEDENGDSHSSTRRGQSSSLSSGGGVVVPRIRGTSFLDDDENEEEEAKKTGVAISEPTLHIHDDPSGSAEQPQSQSQPHQEHDLIVNVDDGGPNSVFPTEFAAPATGNDKDNNQSEWKSGHQHGDVDDVTFTTSTPPPNHVHADLPDNILTTTSPLSTSLMFIMLCIAGSIWVWVQKLANDEYHYSNWTMTSLEIIAVPFYVSIWQWLWSLMIPTPSSSPLSCMTTLYNTMVSIDDQPFSFRASARRTITDLIDHKPQMMMVVAVRVLQVTYSLGIWHLTLRYGHDGESLSRLILQLGVARSVLSWSWTLVTWSKIPSFLAMTTHERLSLFTRRDRTLKLVSCIALIIALTYL
jgi:hypothetical protein